MTNCCVKGCTTTTRHCSKSKNSITFHGFPADPVRNEVWSRIMRMQRGDPYFKYNKYAKVCSLHFTADSFYTTKKGRIKLKDTSLPCLKLGLETKSNLQESLQEADKEVHPEEDNLKHVDIKDLECIFESPLTIKLKRKIEKYEMRHISHIKTIKRLRTEVHRLRKRNALLHGIVKKFKQKVTNMDIIITQDKPERTSIDVTPGNVSLHDIVKNLKQKLTNTDIIPVETDETSLQV